MESSYALKLTLDSLQSRLNKTHVSVAELCMWTHIIGPFPKRSWTEHLVVGLQSGIDLKFPHFSLLDKYYLTKGSYRGFLR